MCHDRADWITISLQWNSNKYKAGKLMSEEI